MTAQLRAAVSPPRSAGGRQRVLFIGGLGRSGSTLIEKLLNELPSMVAVGETVHLWERGVRDRERCGCGEPFARCPLWSAVGAAAFDGWDHVDLSDVIGLRLAVDRSRRLPEIIAANRRGRPTEAQSRYVDYLYRVLVAASAGAGGPSVLIDSSKHLSTAGLLAIDGRAGPLDVRILHLVRDPRGVAYSWTKEVARPETDGALMPTYQPARTATRWVTDNAGFELLGRMVPTMRLRYEDFLGDPAGSIRAIARFVDVSNDEIDLGFLDGDGASITTPMHSVAGNPLRFGGDSLTLRLDDAWRRELTSRDRRIVTAIAAPLLARYGYPLQ